MAAQDTKESAVSYKDTLNLPQTDFPMRANAKEDDLALVARWEKEQLFKESFECNKGNEKFILHDGPPYANGPIHLGTSYNKILKDIVTKSRRMMGMHVPVTPGWDCHGLPIELKVTQEKPGLSPTDLKKACRAFANQWIEVQKASFKRLGVLMNWGEPYLTMSFSYEASILRAFAQFVAQGYIERKNKTVPWCMYDQTVLAMAEIEYFERKDPSLYVLFALSPDTINTLWPALKNLSVSLVIWTTTPWTLPLNRAVLIKPGADYAVVAYNDGYIMLAASLVEKLSQLLNVPLPIVHTISAEHFLSVSPQAEHPFIPDQKVPIIPSPTVQLNEGTALVHCAPGCGPEDYEIGVKNKLEIYSPISPDGRYTADIKPAALQGMLVTDGQIWVIKELASKGKIVYKSSIKHSYPHCWRCRNGLIFRATKQWFCDLSKNDLKEKAVQSVDTIAMFPPTGTNRLKSTMEGRLEWCLSRQRIWGVPIPAIICTECDHTFISPEFIEKVAAGVAQEGIEYWDTVSLEQLLPSGYRCASCKGNSFTKEHDILDVWFESGISHYAVLYKNPALGFPADLYLEGSDQHRAWFQSSLLTGLVLEDKAPMRAILTHCYTVDGQGRKMSKSIGNVVAPQEVIDQLGTDGLRLWASSIDYGDDAVLSPALIENVKEVYRKIRNTARFLLSNLYDFDKNKNAVAIDQLLPIDQYALHELIFIHASIIDAYNRYDFTGVFHILGEYSAKQLSSFYLDVVKDRLYVEKAGGLKRRSAQTVCWYILDTLTRLIAPVLSFTAEQVSDHYQKDKKHSIHLQSFALLENLWAELNGMPPLPANTSQAFTMRFIEHVKATHHELAYMQLWQQLLSMRPAVLKTIEKVREQGIVKHSLEVQLTLYWDPATMQAKELILPFFEKLNTQYYTQDLVQFLKEFFIVSQVVIASEKTALDATEYPGLYAQVAHAPGHKCPRCWHWEVNDHPDHLCKRCQEVLKK